MAVTRVSFVAAAQAPEPGEWIIERVSARRGESLAPAAALGRIEAPELLAPAGAVWTLHGVRSHERYLERAEKNQLAAVQEGLGRSDSRRAVLIPMSKSAAWWDLAQDERRALFENRSRHIEIGSAYLPAIARRLYHARDLGGPFDFLTWFEFEPAHAEMFEELVGMLRATEEWNYVEREVDIRVERERLDAG